MNLEELFHKIVEGEREKYINDSNEKDNKLEEIKSIFNSSKLKFVITFASYISPSQLELFHYKSDGTLEDNSYITRLQIAYGRSKKNIETDVKLKNDRWMMFEELFKNSDFFTDKRMRERDPQLYDTMIGNYLNDKEKEELKPNLINSGFSGVMQQFVDSERISKRKHQSNDNIMKLYEEVVIKGNIKLLDNEDIIEEEKEDEKNSNKEFLRNEFLNIMKQRFINGEDSQFFDYDSYKIKDKKKFNDIMERDLEDSYFDED
ncbi:Protein of unknown function DUF2052, coiled-coil family-containing protein [Strongyloides ratti]|uniref:CCD97-like C-terminal domain-containing protein n=1 Tax=Strongyloides ratti TaxID=34506 RepID=A0A090MZW7_STRRB|nr:Protein of unknown function DUF2052, coiled-coil family-containing protein [Strongyloides ratti]CEF69655.1 Protein of unknown function DUF2052, coiled-coil family-containing protein [Strongyloides ratti]